jgi:hypothetical protein
MVAPALLSPAHTVNTGNDLILDHRMAPLGRRIGARNTHLS